MNKSVYKKVNIIMDIISAALMIGMIVCTFAAWKNAPDIIAIHYNFNGEADGYGSKSSIFLLLFIGFICYAGILILSKYPHIYNYCIEINESNKEKQFSMAQTFMKILNAEQTAIFFYIQFNILMSIFTERESISGAVIAVFMAALSATIGIYIWKQIKNK